MIKRIRKIRDAIRKLRKQKSNTRFGNFLIKSGLIYGALMTLAGISFACKIPYKAWVFLGDALGIRPQNTFDSIGHALSTASCIAILFHIATVLIAFLLILSDHELLKLKKLQRLLFCLFFIILFWNSLLLLILWTTNSKFFYTEKIRRSIGGNRIFTSISVSLYPSGVLPGVYFGIQEHYWHYGNFLKQLCRKQFINRLQQNCKECQTQKFRLSLAVILLLWLFSHSATL